MILDSESYGTHDHIRVLMSECSGSLQITELRWKDGQDRGTDRFTDAKSVQKKGVEVKVQ